MKKFILSIVMATALTACGEKAETTKENGKPVVKIGATLPLTGNLSDAGSSAKEAILMAFEKWKQKDTKYDYQLFIEDDASMPQKAVLNTQNFINVKEVEAVLSMYGIVDRPVDEIANKSEIISLSCSYGKLDVLPYSLNLCVQNKEVADILIPKLRKENIKKVALIMTNTIVSRVVGDYFAERLPKEGFEVVAYEKYNMDIRDMRVSIMALEEKNPDYYITFATSPITDIFVKQLKETVGKNNITSLGSFPEIAPNLLHLVEGLWTVDTTAGTEEFEKEFIQKNNKRLKACTANSYDNLDILVWAFENTAVKEGEKLPKNLDVINTIKEIKNWNGVSGKISFENGIASPKAKIKMYQNGRFVEIYE